MRYLKNLMAIGFVILSLVFASNIYAADKTDDKGKEGTASQEKHKGMEEKRQKVWDQLNLTADQKKQLEENKAKNRESMKATFETMKSCKESLRAELMKKDLDMNKINSIQSQIKSLQGQMVDSRLSSILDIRKILTYEQFGKFIEITGKHKSWHGKDDKDTGKDKEKSAHKS